MDVVEGEAGQRAARLAQARAALAAAESKAGVRSMAHRHRDHHLALSASEAMSAGPSGSDLPHRGGALPAPRELELPSPWQSLCRSLDLGEGGVLSLSGSMQLLLHAAARGQGAQGWCAIVGSDYVGWLAAQEAGLALERTLSIPLAGVTRGRQRAEYAPLLTRVVVGLIDGVDVVIVSAPACSVIPPADRRRLAARARERHVTLLLADSWQGHPSFQAHGQWAWEQGWEKDWAQGWDTHASSEEAAVTDSVSSVERAGREENADYTVSMERAEGSELGWEKEMPAGYLQGLRWRLSHGRSATWSYLDYTARRGLHEQPQQAAASTLRARGHLRLVGGEQA